MTKFLLRWLLAFGFGVSLLITGQGHLLAKPLYVVTQKVPIGSPDKWDLLTYDPPSHRVYIAHWTETTIVDGQSGKIVGTLTGLAGAHGQAIAPSPGDGYASNGESGLVTVFDPATLKVIKKVPADDDADVVIYDPASRRVFVMNGDSKSMTVIDTAENHATTVRLGGSPEAGAVDRRGRLFVNIESTGEIVRIDTATAKITARWPIPSCLLPHGMAIDIQTHRLFTSCFNSRLIVVNTDTGNIVATLPIGKGTDGAAFDPKRRRILSSNGDGTLSVIQERSANRFRVLDTVRTTPGARTMTIDPATGRLFLVAGDVAKSSLPKRPGGPPQFAYVPGSAQLLILDPVR